MHAFVGMVSVERCPQCGQVSTDSSSTFAIFAQPPLSRNWILCSIAY
jgi:hypothetical protein